jgi:CheY-like chemotaxis protein
MSRDAVAPMNSGPNVKPSGLCVLVADDDASTRGYLRGLLQTFDCAVVEAADGEAAVRLFEQQRPDCVLMDAHMPVMDGLAACAAIKGLCGEHFTPVLVLTSDHTIEMNTMCAEAGADELILKPVVPEFLQAKVRSFAQIRKLHDLLRTQRDELLSHQIAMHEEHALASALMRHVTQRDGVGCGNVRRLELASDGFHGDIVLAAWSPAGRQHVLVGDFTGHGLQAALGALPASDVFFSMTKAGFSIPDIVRELNARMRSLFPANIFLCACALDIDHINGMLSVWNGGLPTAFVRSTSGQLRTLQSRHLPLGVVGPRDFDDSIETIPIAHGERVYVHTDGVAEQSNSRGEPFGEARIKAILGGKGDAELLFERLEMAIATHRGDVAQHDDTTFIEVLVNSSAAPCLVAEPNGAAVGALRPATDWSLELQLDGKALRELDPKPLLMRSLQELQGLDPHRDVLLMVLGELYSNALEHGVLGCESALKSDPDGFAKYYAQREKRLADLTDGRITVRLAHRALPEGGELSITVRDTGAGFDFERLAPAVESCPSGRGVALVRSFCNEVRFADGGRSCTATYRWKASPAIEAAAA